MREIEGIGKMDAVRCGEPRCQRVLSTDDGAAAAAATA